jgi:transcriptional regulator with XRE-family HTH domain
MMETWLPRKLRLLRVRQGLTLVEASKKTGVTRVTLSELERGHREPVAPTLVKIAEGYGVPVEELLEEPVAPLGEAPVEAGLADDLTTKVDEIRNQYLSRSKGLELLCERWEAQLVSLGENLDRETLDEMSIVGTYVTDFFLQAAVEETVKIAIALVAGHPGRPSNAAVAAAENAAQKSSIMRPALLRWEKLGKEIYLRGVEKFGEAAARAAINIDDLLTPMSEVDDSRVVNLTRHRLEKERRAS